MKEIQLKYFGMVAERMGVDSESIQTQAENVEALVKELENRQWLLAQLPYQVAVNQELKPTTMLLNDGDEVALLPPFAGG